MKKISSTIIIFLFSIIPLFDLLSPGLPITHDGQDHVARIANFYQNLSEGVIIPRWAANLNWGFGHPILMFLYPLPSYFASFFHFLGFSLIDSTKIVFGVAYIASGIAMYLWIKTFLGEKAGIIAGMLYIFAPYRFVDLYVRGAIGEHVAFVFPPLLCYFLLNLSQEISIKNMLGTSISLALLILAHNAISLMFLPVIFLYVLYLLWQVRKKKVFFGSIAITFLLGFGLSAFFWIPAFFEGKYTLRDIVTKGEYSSRFVSFQSFFLGPWNYGGSGQLSKQVGIPQWMAVISGAFITIHLFKKRNPLWIVTLFLLATFVLVLFLMTSVSSILWDYIALLQKFQFPWRFLSVTVFITAALGGLSFLLVPKKNQLIVYCLLFIALLLLNKDYWHAKGYLLKPESFYTGIYDSTTDTGESSPRWSVRFMEKRPKAPIEVVEGKASIIQGMRTFTTHVYTVIAVQRTRLRENTLYFPGWQVLVDGKKTDIEFQDPRHRGLITFFMEKGTHDIVVIFMETKLRKVANIASLVSLILICGLALEGYRERLLWRKKV